jgi:hypothetical protein
MPTLPFGAGQARGPLDAVVAVVAVVGVLVEDAVRGALAADVLDDHDVAVRGEPLRRLEPGRLNLRRRLAVLGPHQDHRDGACEVSGDRRRRAGPPRPASALRRWSPCSPRTDRAPRPAARRPILSAGAALTIVSSAQASGGCGPAFHRGPYGGCRPNVGPGPVVVGVGGPGIGVFYAGRGYWDGHRYWHNRYRWNGGWRYR